MHPSKRRRTTVKDVLTDRGFGFSQVDGHLVGTGGLLPGVDEGQSIVLISPRDAEAITVGSHVATAAGDGHVPVLIADTSTAQSIEAILAAPFLLADESDDRRTFYSIPDRVQLPDGSYACINTPGPIEWHERTADDRSEGPRLHCRAGDTTVVRLADVSVLECPPADPFPYRYRRNDDRQFEILDGDSVIDVFGSVGQMRTAGYRPLSAPLIPEQYVRSNQALARAALVAVVDGGTVEFRQP